MLADHHFGHARRAQVHGRVGLDHEHRVAERGDVGAAGGGRAEQAAHLRHLAREPHLVGEDATRAATPREQLDLVGDAGAGGVDEVHDRELVPECVLGEAHDLLHRARPHDPAFTVGSFAITHTGRPSTRPIPVTTPSAGRSPARALASSASSTNESSSRSSAMRSRTNSLFCRASFSPSLARLPSRARSASSRTRSPSVTRRSRSGGSGRPHAGARSAARARRSPAPTARSRAVRRGRCPWRCPCPRACAPDPR